MTDTDGLRCGGDVPTARFTRLFRRLIVRWADYQDVPRDPARVAELGAARTALDQIRTEIAVERDRVAAQAPLAADRPRVAVSEADLHRLRVAGAGFDHA